MRNLCLFLLISSLLACSGNPGPSQEGDPVDTTTPTTPPETGETGSIEDLEKTKWQLVSYELEGKTRAVPQDVDITLILRRGRASGTGGCNTFTATYELKEGNALAITDVAATKKLCKGFMMAEQIYLDLLANASSMIYQTEKLNITSSKGQLYFVKA